MLVEQEAGKECTDNVERLSGSSCSVEGKGKA